MPLFKSCISWYVWSWWIDHSRLILRIMISDQTPAKHHWPECIKKKKKETCYPRNLVLILSSISFLEFLFILTQDTEDREGSSSRIQGDFVWDWHSSSANYFIIFRGNPESTSLTDNKFLLSQYIIIKGTAVKHCYNAKWSFSIHLIYRTTISNKHSSFPHFFLLESFSPFWLVAERIG